MFLTGPKVVKTVTGEDVSQEDLGGASVHSTKSGVTHFTAETEEEAMEMIRTLISYIPQNNMEEAPRVVCTDPIDRMEDVLNEIIPDNPNKAYDMYDVIGAIVDNGEFFEVQPDYAKNIIVGFARFNGQSVGVVANQPNCYAGVLDCNASRKGARFVRFCDAFNIPLVTLVDVPGFLPGTGQEYNAVILHGAKLLYAYGEATVPKVTVTLRKSYGGSHIVMSCKQLRGDLNYAMARRLKSPVMGCIWRRSRIVCQRSKRSRRPESIPCREGGRVQQTLHQSLPGCQIRVYRRCHRTAQHSASASSAHWHSSRPKAWPILPKSMAIYLYNMSFITNGL